MGMHNILILQPLYTRLIFSFKIKIYFPKNKANYLALMAKRRSLKCEDNRDILKCYCVLLDKRKRDKIRLNPAAILNVRLSVKLMLDG